MPQKIHRGLKARHQAYQGAYLLAEAVRRTYGPRGRTVCLERSGGLINTKDGVSVAWEIEPAQALNRFGSRLIQQACDRVNSRCGDGTSTTAIVCASLLREAEKHLAAGANPALLSRELHACASELTIETVQSVCEGIPLEDEELLEHVAMTASNRDEQVAQAIVKALALTGSEGMIVVEEGKGREVEVEHKRGLELEQGWESREFAGSDGIARHLDAPLVALIDAELTSLTQVQSLLEEATQFPHPFLIVSRGCFGEALKVLNTNDRKLEVSEDRVFQCVASRCPGHVDMMRDHLEDLAALTGATVIDPSVHDITKIQTEWFGSVQTATVKARTTTLVGFEERFEAIEERVEALLSRCQTSEFSYDVEQLKSRIAKLSDGFCVLRVGAASETELKERRGRVEDALHAVQAAVEWGVCPGGAISYLMLASHFDRTESTVADKMLLEALKSPLKALAVNAGCEPSVIIRSLLNGSERPIGWGQGWDAHQKQYRSLCAKPAIVDSVAVVREVVCTALSVVATFITAEVFLEKV